MICTCNIRRNHLAELKFIANQTSHIRSQTPGHAPMSDMSSSRSTKELVFSELPDPQMLLRALTLDSDDWPLSPMTASDSSSYAQGAYANSRGSVSRWSCTEHKSHPEAATQTEIELLRIHTCSVFPSAHDLTHPLSYKYLFRSFLTSKYPPKRTNSQSNTARRYQRSTCHST
jgi:hypothetical protein